jgi:hypothetical protein
MISNGTATAYSDSRILSKFLNHGTGGVVVPMLAGGL